MRLFGIVLGLGMIAIPAIAAGQTGDFAIPAGSALPNYDRISIGQREGIEANAFVARTNDAGANWYNPAGLAQSERSAINASANAYEFTGLALVGHRDRPGRHAVQPRSAPSSGASSARRSSSRTAGASASRTPSRCPGSRARSKASCAASARRQRKGCCSPRSVSLTTSIPAVAVGYRLSDRVRLGASIGYAITSLNQRASLSDRLCRAPYCADRPPEHRDGRHHRWTAPDRRGPGGCGLQLPPRCDHHLARPAGERLEPGDIPVHRSSRATARATCSSVTPRHPSTTGSR